MVFSISSILAKSQGSRAAELAEDATEVIFRVEACKARDGGDRVAFVFEIFYCYVDADRVDEVYRSDSELFFEEVVHRRLADTAFARDIRDGDSLVPIFRYELDCRAERFVDRKIARSHLGEYPLQKLVEEGVRLELV